jgi:hypothetical protein
VFKLADGTISWESKKQPTIALSSTEAEYMGLAAACNEAIYLQRLFREMFGIEEKVVIHNDNQSALKLSCNPVFHNCIKHINVIAVSNKLPCLFPLLSSIQYQ